MTSAARTVERRWAITNEVRPANSGRSAAWMNCSESVSRFEVASSRMLTVDEGRAGGVGTEERDLFVGDALDERGIER